MKKNRLKKKVLFLAMLLTVGSLAPAFPETAPEAAVRQGEASNEELFAAYVNQLFYPSMKLSLRANYGNDANSKLSAQQKKAYNYLKDAIAKIADGSVASAMVEIPASVANLRSGQEELPVKYLLDDCPYELYWSTGGFASASVEGKYVRIYFDIATDYRAADGYNQKLGLYTKVDNTKVKRAIAAKEAADKIVEKNASLDDVEKMKAYVKAVSDLVDYDEESSTKLEDYTVGIDPWRMINVFDGDSSTNVVCEGYARAFQYLCDQSAFTNSSIVSRIVTGTMDGGTGAGPHMWNVVRMGDGKNYIVDVTNCDQGSVGEPDKLFLASASGSMQAGYTVMIAGQGLIRYVYDEDALAVYQTADLKISSEKYDPAAVPAETPTPSVSPTPAASPLPSSAPTLAASPLPSSAPASAPTASPTQGMLPTESPIPGGIPTASPGTEPTPVPQSSPAPAVSPAPDQTQASAEPVIAVDQDKQFVFIDLGAPADPEELTYSLSAATWDKILSQIGDLSGSEYQISFLQGNNSLSFYASDYQPGADLAVYQMDWSKLSWGNAVIMSDLGSVSVGEDGDLTCSLPAGTYSIFGEGHAKYVNKRIEDTIQLKAAKKKLKKGKTFQISLQEDANLASIASIKYKSSKKKLVSVDARGMAKAKKKGRAVITLKVVMKNGDLLKRTVKVSVK